MKILLVDDHGVVRRGVRELLVEEFPDAKFEEAASGEDAVALAAREAFNLVVLDVSMPRRGGIDALKDLQERAPQCPVLVLSHHAEEQYAIRALRAGARGYITKNSAPEELIRAVRKVVGGGKYVTEALAERLADLVDRNHNKALHEELSDRELQVMQMLATGKSVKEIGAELSLSEKTVSTYRNRILEKMDMKTNAELTRYALQIGLVE